MKKLITIGGLIVLVSGIALYYRHSHKPYDDLNATATALRHVTSWHE